MFCHGELCRAAPGAAPPDALLPDGLGRRRARRPAGGGGRAARLQRATTSCGLALVALALARGAALRAAARGSRADASLAVLLAVAAGAASTTACASSKDVLLSTRNFYGVLRVKEYGTPGEPSHLRRLVHGVIMHGEQYLDRRARRRPTTYYQPTSGIGAALARAPRRAGRCASASSAWAPARSPPTAARATTTASTRSTRSVVRVARARVHLPRATASAKIEVALGDARLTLEREPPQSFDVLAVDAFSSDAIPVHLITREALALYLRHVKPDGIVAFHVSNRFLELVPVVARLAQRERRARGGWCTTSGEDEDDDRTQTRLGAGVARPGGAAGRGDRGGWRRAGRGPPGLAHLDRRLLQPGPDPEVKSGSDPISLAEKSALSLLDDRAFVLSLPRASSAAGRTGCGSTPSHITSGLATSTEE